MNPPRFAVAIPAFEAVATLAAVIRRALAMPAEVRVIDSCHVASAVTCARRGAFP
jgi:hypothetical protein